MGSYIIHCDITFQQNVKGNSMITLTPKGVSKGLHQVKNLGVWFDIFLSKHVQECLQNLFHATRGLEVI